MEHARPAMPSEAHDPSGILAEYGWDPGHDAAFTSHLALGRLPARVVAEDRGGYVVQSARGEGHAAVSGRFRFEAGRDAAAMPVVGDWVAAEFRADGATIRAVLPRRTALVRRAPADRTSPTQILAANVDVVFVTTSLNQDFNLRRLERYLAIAWDSGATPVVLLSKADVAEDAEARRAAAAAIAPGVAIVILSAIEGTGLDAVRSFLGRGRTAAIIGSSGVGKSTLVNALAERALLDTGGIRLDDARGRHTTTRRQLLRLPDGLVLDTPGMRELGVTDEDGVGATFADIDALATECRFSDCAHEREPGCAVLAALADGSLSNDRVLAHRRLIREARRAERSRDAVARMAERRRWTAISRGVDRHMRLKYGDER